MTRGRGRGGQKPPATDALVARLSEFGESSAVAVLLTSDRGAVHVLAKGAKRVQNGFLGPLDKGVLYRVRLGRRAGEGLVLLGSSSTRDAFPNLRAEAPRFLAASLVLEVVADLMRENEPNPDLFRLAIFSLKALDRAPGDRLPLVTALFLARALALSGHPPELARCVACGRSLGEVERPLVSALRGGALHPACGQGEPGARSLPAPLLGLLRALLERPAARSLELDAPPRALAELRRFLVRWLEHALERRFRAAAPLEDEFSLRVGAPG